MIICLAGNDGAGKSTQCSVLVQRLREQGFSADLLDRWEIVDNVNYPECSFVKPDAHNFKKCITSMESPARLLFAAWNILIPVIKRCSDDKTIFISDGYWFKHFASELCLGVDVDLVNSLIKLFPQPDFTILFSIPVETIIARKTDYTLYECGYSKNIDADGFMRHQRRIFEKLGNFVKFSKKYTVINADKSVDIVSSNIWNLVESHLAEQLVSID